MCGRNDLLRFTPGGACICTVVLDFVGQRAALIRGAGTLKVNKCELMNLCSRSIGNGLLCSELNAIVFSSIDDPPVKKLSAFLSQASRGAIRAFFQQQTRPVSDRCVA